MTDISTPEPSQEVLPAAAANVVADSSAAAGNNAAADSSAATDSSASRLQADLRRYAELLIRSGCNLQPGQELLLSVSTNNVEFARLLTAEAYRQGARHVTVRFGDEQLARLHYENCALEVFEQFPEWQALLNNSMAENGAAVLSITSENPLALEGIDQNKLVANARAAHEACKSFYDYMDQGRIVWCIAAAPSPAWARYVFPDRSTDEAIAALWETIFKIVRLDSPDACAAWEEHRQSFDQRKSWLNGLKLDALHYTNRLGTDLTVGLNAGGIWSGGGAVTDQGICFFPNIPTEEIFTTPDRLRADGIVYSSMPLVHYGQLIEDFSLTFAGGKVVDCQARSGLEVLKAALSVDENASRLGECALVPWTSPIRQSGILFYNTLYDENASCHLAFGQGFPECLEGGTTMGEDERLAAGVNKSATHVDFMIGTADLRIEGILKDGSRISIFEEGEWLGI